MISIVISSVNKQNLENVRQNIANSIGVPHEIIVFENGEGDKGICKIYNEGARVANFDILCFMHEDIIIKTPNWGTAVINDFARNKSLGLLGIAGSSFKTQAPSGWGTPVYEVDTNFYNYEQHFKHSGKKSMYAYHNPRDKKLEKVVVLDGVWLCTTRAVLSNCRFDEDLFKGFHCYDLDFSLTVGQYFDVAVTFDVLLEHFSEGGYNREWFFDTLKLHEKWQAELPKTIEPISDKLTAKMEKRALLRILFKMFQLGFTSQYIFAFLSNYKKQIKMSNELYLKHIYYLIKIIYLGKTID